MKFTPFVLAAALALTAGTATAQTAKDPTARMEKRWANVLKRMDADKDGAVSRDEALKSATRVAGKLDADKDGFVTRAEFVKVKPGPKAEIRTQAKEKAFIRMGGKDGKIPVQAFADTAVAKTMRADADKDGKVTKAEYMARGDKKGKAKPKAG